MTTSGFVEVLLFIIILIMVSPLTDVQASLGCIHCMERKKTNGCNLSAIPNIQHSTIIHIQEMKNTTSQQRAEIAFCLMFDHFSQEVRLKTDIWYVWHKYGAKKSKPSELLVSLLQRKVKMLLWSEEFIYTWFCLTFHCTYVGPDCTHSTRLTRVNCDMHNSYRTQSFERQITPENWRISMF